MRLGRVVEIIDYPSAECLKIERPWWFPRSPHAPSMAQPGRHRRRQGCTSKTSMTFPFKSVADAI